jgi:regulation of enolase protein 1 (concanavalin A-like superfamily)
VEGISSDNTPGYFPPPTRPTYSGTSAVSATGAAHIPLKGSWDGTAYLIEAGINTTEDAGIMPYRQDDENWIKAGLRRQGNVWYFGECINGNYTETASALPADFRFGVYHTIRIERNGMVYTVWIDEMPAPGRAVFQTAGAFPCTPALFAGKGESLFDGITYTRGWEETGIQVTSGDFSAFKGDLLSQYEFSLQVNNPADQGETGIYPVYIDAQNYVKAGLDYGNRRLNVQVRQKGKTVLEKTYPLESRESLYADMKQTDFIEKRYTFPSPTWINALFLNRTVYGNPQQYVENMFDKVSVEYLWENKWRPITGASLTDPSHPGFNRMDFQPIRTEALRFTNKQPDDLQSYIYRIRVNQLFHSSYNLRAVKTKDAVRLFVDGKEITALPPIPGKSQVGLFSTNCQPSFNGLMLYEIPE